VDTPAALLAPEVMGSRRVFCCHMANFDRRFPPNSLEAVRACATANVPRVEVDVQFLADGAMLVFHDAVFERLTTASGDVRRSEATHARTARLLASAETRLCFLEEVVEALMGCDTVLQVDLKAQGLLTPDQADSLSRVLAPLGARALLGTMGHWNLRLITGSGIRLAFDPTLHLRHAPPDRGAERLPQHRGKFGLWDDSPAAHLLDGTFDQYLATRIDDLVAMAPGVAEWMVDIGTLLFCDEQGVAMGHRLSERGIALAAWTLNDEGEERSVDVLRRLFALGTTTIITDDAVALANYSRLV